MVNTKIPKKHNKCPKTTWKDWYKSAEKALLELKKECNKIKIIGSSSGGSLAILLASKYKYDSLVLMGTIMKFKRHSLLLTAVLFAGLFKKKIKKVHKPKIIEF